MKRLILLFIATFLMFALSACKEEEPQPEERFAAYTKLWNSQKFDEMYDYLSTDAKKGISKKDFIDRYEKIYDGIEIENLKITYKKPKEIKEDSKRKNASLPYDASMETIAGPVNFSQKAKFVKEERDKAVNWYIDWNPKHIFPELKEGEKVSVDSYPAVRGEIVDRNERGLALNGSVYEAGIVPEKMTGNEQNSISQTAKLLNMSEEEIQKQLDQTWVQPGSFVPLKKFSMEQTALLEQLIKVPGVMVNETEDRIYPYKEATAHLIGYIGPISAEELEKRKGEGYSANDVIGKRGLEQVFEERLKGEGGASIYIKAENGQEKVIATKPAEEGETIYLTIDAELQKTILAQYKGAKGTAAAIHPVTGETLALVSSPSFDPNKFVLGISQSERTALEKNPDKPLLNRFTSLYSPGSTIKPLVAAAALENGVDPNKAMNIKGLQWQKSKSWGNYRITRVHDYGKPVNMKDALVYSDNIYFAQKALELGQEKFTAGLKKFGFEEKMIYEYPMSAAKIGDISTEIKLADSGYGQGQLQATSLHMAAAYTAFVNNGSIIAPTLELDKEQQTWKPNTISANSNAAVMAGLKEIVTNPKGTAHSAADLGIPIAGKTGTAELKQKQGETGTENGWFVAFNTENPRLLIALMQENVPKGGSKHAVDKVEAIMTNYFRIKH
ncbi:penicillin-binding transpeptidase domain-containing protein [Peribacillus saganii]|uniref:serine-type D-Ala-D-Ala carboxypeptidase n=1 Tax=Peribacillus saganii TaxID=2303992 RepID=A0A372LKI7_9BACI|nr:penicillin-binding transpeptidase domain-containing protein [Peribacillus saganii]RFU67112.1 penicillin-binding transpeptidase domain-containing protein [Peribacillus saganii]